MAVTSILTSYHLFLTNYLRGLLFLIKGCEKLQLIKQRTPVFTSVEQLFEQRILSFMNTGILPPFHYSDFTAVFEKDEYDGGRLVMNGVKYLESAQKIVMDMKKETHTSKIVWNDCCTMCQRVDYMI